MLILYIIYTYNIYIITIIINIIIIYYLNYILCYVMIHDGYLEVVGAADENSSEETRTQPSCVRPIQLKCLTASTCHWRFPDAVTLLPRLPSFQAPLCTFPNLRFRCQSATGEGADFGLSGCQAWLRRASSQAQPVRDIKSSRLNVLIFFFFKWSSK